MAKIILPRQVNVLLDQILDKSDNPQFLETKGLFRVVGNKTEIKRAFKAFLSSPKDFELDKQQSILADPHNVIGLLIDTVSSTEKPVKFSKEALTILNECIGKMAKSAKGNPIDDMMDALAQANQVEEAKLFHNLFYLAHRIVQYSDSNQANAELIANALINSEFLYFSGLSPDEEKYFTLLEKIPNYSLPLIENSNRFQVRMGRQAPEAAVVELPPKVELVVPPTVEQPKVESIVVPKVESPKVEDHHVPSLDEISSTFVTEWTAAKKASKQDWLALISDFKVMGNFIKNVSTKVSELQNRFRSSDKNEGGKKPKP